MALPQLVQSRKTSGRYDDGGRFIETEADAAQFSEWATRGTPPDTVLSLHSIPGFNFAGQYGGHRTIRLQDGPNDPLVIADARAMTPTEMSAIAKKSGVQIVGGFWRIDRKVKGPKLTALHYDEHQPGPLEWLFVSGTDLVRTIGPDADPFATWEWNDALGLDAISPSAAPGPSTRSGSPTTSRSPTATRRPPRASGPPARQGWSRDRLDFTTISTSSRCRSTRARPSS